MPFRRSTNPSGGYSANNSVRLIRGGSPYFDALEMLIDQAKETIHFQVYIMESDETGMRISNALMRAAGRGVKVYMLLDGYASSALSEQVVNDFRTAGIHFRWFEPLFKGHNFFVGRRMHHKVIVADNANALVGGLNITNRYNDMPDEPAWLDWAVLASGDVCIELYNRCLQMWYRRPPADHSKPVMRKPSGDRLVRVRINDRVRNKDQISRSYLEMFRGSHEHITIMSSYFMPGRIFRKQLRLASGRGIKIRIILTKISDVTIAKQAERFFYPWLLRRNVEIYEYRKKVLHGKMASCDGQWVTVGSYNFNDLSAYASIELNLDIKDPIFSNDVELAFSKIMKDDCDRITSESFTHNTHWWNLAIYRSAYALCRLLLLVFTFSFSNKRHR
ncbi:MAG TPA: phospholipase D-like domain-containing protein [Chryseolinea sp.]|nr:phospholipase D-like domain-containing protein [Chryseolinea sp.]